MAETQKFQERLHATLPSQALQQIYLGGFEISEKQQQRWNFTEKNNMATCYSMKSPRLGGE